MPVRGLYVLCWYDGHVCVFFFSVFPLVQGKVETSVVLVVDELGGKHNLQRFLGGTGDKSDASMRRTTFHPSSTTLTFFSAIVVSTCSL